MNTELKQRDEDDIEEVYYRMNNASLHSKSIYWCLLCVRYYLIAEDINCTKKDKVSTLMKLIFQHRWETDSKKKPPHALSSGRYYGKSLCKEKALRVIGRKSESEQCRCEDGNIQGSRSNECKCPGARCTWPVQRADVYGALFMHHS